MIKHAKKVKQCNNKNINGELKLELVYNFKLKRF